LPDVPDEASLSTFYAAYVESHREALGGRPSVLGLAFWWTHPLMRILEDAAGLRGRRLLEIGCSSGAFLERARVRGAFVSGVEVDEVARAEARRAGLDCTAEIQRGARYDIVCAFQVLEHLADPHMMVGQVAEVLVDDGVFLAAVPNGGQAARVGNTWVGFRRDLEHLQYFSIGTLAALLSAHGLLVESFWEEGQPSGMLRVPRPPAGPLGRAWHGARALFASSSDRPFPADGSFNLVVLARKAACQPSAHS
jgi:SAM-dependent methyltransferase